MIVTTRKETYFKIEMTTEQAHNMDWFFDHLQERQLFDVASMAGCNAMEKISMLDTLADFHAALKARHGT